MKSLHTLLYVLPLLWFVSCLKLDTQINSENSNLDIDYNADRYIYPFGKESTNITAEVIIKLENQIPSNIRVEVPPLKYNKSLLFMFTQDDCKQVAYCSTWASINGKPLTRNYYYNSSQLKYGDLPPDSYYLGNTLGCTDGAGHEVRFAFTTTLLPQSQLMNAYSQVRPKFTDNYYRFYMNSALIWQNVREMLNYGVGIAFHDIEASDVKDPLLIKAAYAIAQDSILAHLSGRGCKFLAEPNGNKAYVAAALSYDPIQTIVVQTGTAFYPFKVDTDLKDVLFHREFNNSPYYFKRKIREEAEKAKENRKAIYVGVHSTDSNWIELLSWLNDNYGKEGDDSLWFPSQEEYYEYNYYRIHGKRTITKIDNNTLKVIVTLPSLQYFYYPSTTINLEGLDNNKVISILSNDVVTGLSYGKYENGTMINIDCRKFLLQHATHFVEKYEKNKTDPSLKADAIYFVNMLKESDEKRLLLERLN